MQGPTAVVLLVFHLVQYFDQKQFEKKLIQINSVVLFSRAGFIFNTKPIIEKITIELILL